MPALDVRVYDKTGTDLLGYIVQPISASFSDEFNACGSGEVTVLLDSPDGALLTKDRLVRVYYKGVCAFAWFVERLERSLTGTDERRTIKATGRGLMGWMDDAIVYPQAGITAAYAHTERMFNFASADGPWMRNADYQPVQGVKWRDDPTVRKGYPKGWPDPDAFWVWTTDPTKPVEAGATAWLRSTFTLDKPERVKFWMSADNRYEVYLDGAPLFVATSGKTQDVSWAKMQTKAMQVPAGTHTVAARVQNEKPWGADGVAVSTDGWFDVDEDAPFGKGDVLRVSGAGDKSGLKDGNYVVVEKDKSKGVQLSGKAGGAPIKPAKKCSVDLTAPKDSTAGFLLTAAVLDAKGRPSRTVERTNKVGWVAASREPEWEPAEVLWACIAEARRRGVSRLDVLTKGWNAETDSEGAPWTIRVDATFPVGATLTEVADYGVNLGLDYWIEPDTLTMKATEVRGADLSDEVRLDLGYNLLSFVTTEERTLKTAALVRTKDGWTEQRWMDDFYGRRETMITVERTRSRQTGRKIADRQLRSLGRRRIVAQTADATPVDGAEPYVTFRVGDIVSVPNAIGRLSARSRARVLSLSLTTDGETVSYSMEVEVLNVTGP